MNQFETELKQNTQGQDNNVHDNANLHDYLLTLNGDNHHVDNDDDEDTMDVIVHQ